MSNQPPRMTPMRCTIIESPYSAPTATMVDSNVAYARRCVRDSLLRGEAPIASHLLHTQPGILRDEVPEERKLGIDAGHAWMVFAHQIAVYTDRGISKGMQLAIDRARFMGVPIVYRSLEQQGQADL